MAKNFMLTGAAAVFRALADAATPAGPSAPRPATLALSQIFIKEALFQPRAMDERHVQGLARTIKSKGAVEPIVVWEHGGEFILLDGHHRVDGYKIAGKVDEIPVEFFEGSLDEALLRAGEANSKAKLPMSTRERQDFGWRLVSLGDFTKAQVMEAASISKGQVDIMRKAKLKLGPLAACIGPWHQARKLAEGGKDEPSDMEDWKEQMAEEYADRLAKAFGNKLSTNPELAAMAFQRYFGRKLPELYHALGEGLSETEMASEDEDEDAELAF